MGLFRSIFSSTRRSLYARSLRKDIAHLSSMSRSIWHLIQWSMKNGAGGVANRSFVRANSNYNTRMYISWRKCEWCLAWQNSPLWPTSMSVWCYGAEMWLPFIVIRLLGCSRWLLWCGYTFTMLIFTEWCPTRVKRAQPHLCTMFWCWDMAYLCDCMVARVL